LQALQIKMALQQPKKPAGGGFGQFLAEKRGEFMKQCAGKPISEVTKLGGAQWKALSEAKQAPYKKKFVEAQAKYKKDLEAFIAAGGVKTKGAAALRAEKRKAKEGGKKAAGKDPNRPKKPAGGAFGCFLDANRQAFIKETKGQPITAVTKLASVRWKTMSDKAKAPFEQAYQKKKAAYEEAMKSYVPPAAAEPEEGEDKDEEEDEDDDEEGEEEEEEESEQSPPAKKAKKAEAPEAKKNEAKKNDAAKGNDAGVFADAKKAGMDRQLKTILELPKIQAKQLGAKAVWDALQDARGKTVVAKKALLGA